MTFAATTEHISLEGIIDRTVLLRSKNKSIMRLYGKLADATPFIYQDTINIRPPRRERRRARKRKLS